MNFSLVVLIFLGALLFYCIGFAVCRLTSNKLIGELYLSEDDTCVNIRLNVGIEDVKKQDAIRLKVVK